MGLVDLSNAQNLCVHKTVEVVIVGKYKDFMLEAL